MGKALPSLILTICRQGLVFIPLILVLNSMFGLDGVIYAQRKRIIFRLFYPVVICMLIFKTWNMLKRRSDRPGKNKQDCSNAFSISGSVRVGNHDEEGFRGIVVNGILS